MSRRATCKRIRNRSNLKFVENNRKNDRGAGASVFLDTDIFHSSRAFPSVVFYWWLMPSTQ